MNGPLTVPLASFGTGETPTIACINQATVPLGVDFSKLITALQAYVDHYFAPIWGTPCKLISETSIPADAWALRFLDDADQAGALGYHDLTPEGLPVSYIFVRTTIMDGQKVSVTASHELAEMLVDPGIQMWAEGPQGTLWAYETADAVEESEFDVDGVAMSDFVFPSFFEYFRKPNSIQFDYMKQVHAPFTLLHGGYTLVRKSGNVGRIFGSAEKARRFQKEDRRLHRGETRQRRHLLLNPSAALAFGDHVQVSEGLSVVPS